MALAEHCTHPGQHVAGSRGISLLTLNAGSAAVDDLVDPAPPWQDWQRKFTVPGGASLGAFALALLDNDPKTLEAAGRRLSADRLFAHASVCYSRAASGYEARTRSAASRRASVLVERLRNAFESGAVPPLGWVPGRAGG